MLDSLLSASLKLNSPSFLYRIPKYILNDGEKTAVGWAINYHRKYEKMPTEERFRAAGFGEYLTTYLIDSPIEDLFDTMLEKKKEIYFFSAVRELEEKIDGGELLSTEQVISLGRNLAMIRREDHISITDIDRTEYLLDESPGLTFGLKSIDTVTSGIYNGEFGILVARTGIGKTMLTCFFAHRWFCAAKKVLFVSLEQTPKQVAQRIDGIIGNFNPNLFRSRADPVKLADRIDYVSKQVEIIKERGGDLIFPKDRRITIESMYSLIEDHEPDIVIVDGLYLMRTSDRTATADWQKLKAISNELKQLSLTYDIPIFSTSQLKRTGKESEFTLEDIAYSDALSQDADLIIVAHKAGTTSRNEIIIEMMKNRNGEGLAGAVVSFDWNTMDLKEADWTDKRETGHVSTFSL